MLHIELMVVTFAHEYIYRLEQHCKKQTTTTN